jgi:pimeloyl-ACP methyl ester carboxylesterase
LSALRDPEATPERMKAPAEAMRRFYLSMSPEQLEAGARMSAAGMVRSGTDVERIARWTSRSDSRTMAQALYEMMTTDLRGDVAAIRVPTLLVAAGDGAGDAQAREKLVASYESQVSRIPKHEVVLAEHARHFVMLDDPAFLEAAIAHFLAGQETVAAAGWAR